MSEKFKIGLSEHGIVRIFAVELPESEIKTFGEAGDEVDAGDPPWALQQALGATYLDAKFVELFPVSDLKGVGLTGYMTEGLGISDADVRQDHPRLETLTGYVLVVLSAAFGGVEQTLTPRAPLRWIGTYAEERTPVEFRPLPTQAATGNAVTPIKVAKISDAAMSGRVATIVLIFLGFLVGLMVWIAG